MFQTTYGDLERKKQKIDHKIYELQEKKQEAINKRIYELNQELNNLTHTENQHKLFVNETREQFEKFKTKNKGLYKIIFQGAKEIDLRKKDFLRQIHGEEEGEQY